MQFTTKGASQVHVKARGKFINRAVDVSQVVLHRFLNGIVKIQDIQTDSEEFTNKEGRQVRVSTINVTLVKL